jgi:hypothetical protein
VPAPLSVRRPRRGGWGWVSFEPVFLVTHRFFQFDQRYIFAGYGGGNQPWTHPDDAPRPATLAVDYQRLDKMPPLQAGGLHDGQTAHGFVGFAMPTGGDLYITINDPEQPAPYTEAGWIVHT